MLKRYPKGKKAALFVAIGVAIFYVMSLAQALGWRDTDRFLTQLIVAPFGIAFLGGIAFLIGAFLDVTMRERLDQSSKTPPVGPDSKPSRALRGEPAVNGEPEMTKPALQLATENQNLPQMNLKNTPLFIVGGIVVFCLALLLFGYGLLIGERETFDQAQIYPDGSTYMIGNVEVSNDVMNSLASSHYFTCSYFSGRGTVQLVLNARDGHRQCPFLKRL